MIKMLKKKEKIITIVLVVLLVLAIGYIILDKWQAAKQQEQMNIYQQGIQVGYEQAIIQIAQQAATCQQVPLRVGNQTVNIIAVECLQTQE